MRVWAAAWDVFRRALSRVGGGGRAAVDFVVRFGFGGFFSLRMRLFLSSGQKSLFYNDNEAFLPKGKKKPLHTGVRTGCLIQVVGPCVCVCVSFVVFTDCESCTRPISSNSGSMEAGECGRSVGRVSSHAVSRWARSPGCCGLRGVFFGGADFLSFSFFDSTRPTPSIRPPCLIYFSTSTGVPTGYHYSISLSVCVRVCTIRRFF